MSCKNVERMRHKIFGRGLSGVDIEDTMVEVEESTPSLVTEAEDDSPGDPVDHDTVKDGLLVRTNSD